MVTPNAEQRRIPQWMTNFVVWCWINWQFIGPDPRFSARNLKALLESYFSEPETADSLPGERTIHRILQLARKKQGVRLDMAEEKVDPGSSVWGRDLDLLIRLGEILRIPTWQMGGNSLQTPTPRISGRPANRISPARFTIGVYEDPRLRDKSRDDFITAMGAEDPPISVAENISQLSHDEVEVLRQWRNIVTMLQDDPSPTFIDYLDIDAQPVGIHPVLAVIKERAYRDRLQKDVQDLDTLGRLDGSDIVEILGMLTRSSQKHRLPLHREGWVAWGTFDLMLNVSFVTPDNSYGSVRDLRRFVDELYAGLNVEFLDKANEIISNFLPSFAAVDCIEGVAGRSEKTELKIPSWYWRESYHASQYLSFFSQHIHKSRSRDGMINLHESEPIVEVPCSMIPEKKVTWIGLSRNVLSEIGLLDYGSGAFSGEQSFSQEFSDYLQNTRGYIFCPLCDQLYMRPSEVFQILMHVENLELCGGVLEKEGYLRLCKQILVEDQAEISGKAGVASNVFGEPYDVQVSLDVMIIRIIARNLGLPNDSPFVTFLRDW